MSRKGKKSENYKYFQLISDLTPVSETAVRPKGGFVYLYEAKDVSTKEDWRADGYKFRQKGGQTNCPFNGSFCKKTPFYSVINDEETDERYESPDFMRIAYEHPDFPLRVLVRYVGDETKQNEYAHGNSKSELKKSRNYVATKKSTRERMKTETGPPSKVYKKLVVEAPSNIDEHEVTAPRDLKQVQNFQAGERRKLRLSRDALYNLHELAGSTGFIKEIVSYPDLICIMYHAEIWEKVKVLLNRSDIPHISFQYDTTFDLGDVYVSVLVVRFQEMENAPVIPLMMMLHERKNNETHDLFFRRVAYFFPELLTAKNIYLVTDEEKAFLKAIREHLPDIDSYRCWNHLMENAKYKLAKLGITGKEGVAAYLKDIRSLFRSQSREDYLLQLTDIYSDSCRWHKDFVAYYKKNIDSQIQRIGRWALKEHNIESADTNSSESFNCVLKRLQEWREAPIDTIALGFEYLCKFYETEISRGRYNMGTYRIRPHLRKLYNRETDNINFPKTISPDDIVDVLRSGLANVLKQKEECLSSAKEKNIAYDSDRISTHDRAAQAITNKMVQYNLDSGEFIINSDRPNGVSCVVKLKPATFSSVACSCPATAICFHIVAAMILSNCSDVSSKRPANSTLMRKKARKEADKKSGKKQPRKKDVDPPVIKVSRSPSPSKESTEEVGLDLTISAATSKNKQPVSHNDDSDHDDSDRSCSSIFDSKLELDDSFDSDKGRQIFQQEAKKVTEVKDNKLPAEVSILDEHYWLNDKEIHFAMQLIKEKFPIVGGLEDTVLGQLLDFPQQNNDEWVQILHNGVNHWLVAAKNKKKNHVDIYDSMGSPPNNHVLGCVSSLIRPSSNSFAFQLKSCQLQKNSSDCGIFAIAFAMTLACGESPSFSSYSPSQMRSHLVSCFKKKEIDPFPAATSDDRVVLCQGSPLKKVKVYCHCRRVDYNPTEINGKVQSRLAGEKENPWDLIQCAGCKEWFHRQCEIWPKKTWGVKWRCQNC